MQTNILGPHLGNKITNIKIICCAIMLKTFFGRVERFAAEQAHVLNSTGSACILAPIRVIPSVIIRFTL